MNDQVSRQVSEWGEFSPRWEDEIDLREIVRTMVRWWWLIVLVPFVAAIAGFGFTTLTRPVQYKASAIVTGTSTKSIQIASSVATSDVVLKKLYNSLSDIQEEIKSYEDLSRYLSVTAIKPRSAKSGVALEFRAKALAPDIAARLDNEWVGLVAETTNETLRKDKEENLKEIEALFNRAREDLTAAEKNLAEVEKEDEVAIINNRLSSLKTLQSQYLAKKRNIKLLLQDVILLRSRLEHKGEEKPSLTDDLAILSLSLRSVGGSGSVQLQVSDASRLFSGDSMSERIDFLRNMQKGLEERLADLDVKSKSLDVQILGAQYELQVAQNRLDEATRKRSTAIENYKELSKKLEEAKVAVSVPQDKVEIFSKAVTPKKPLPRHRLLNAAIAAVTGFMLAVFGVFVIEWWKGDESAGSEEANG